ncbi:MAG TPA: GAF domain-containing protein [Chloroflexota bacterium]|nr:GAF domain-containing protein [Chloroflexota bacterium]
MTTSRETPPLSAPERAADALRHADDPGLWTMAATLFSTPDPSTLLARVVAAAHRMSGADAVAILLYNRQLGLFEPVTPSVAVGLDDTWSRQQGLPAAQSLAARALETGDIVEVRDTAAVPEMEFPHLRGGARPGSVRVAPLQVEGQFVGVLSFYDLDPRIEPTNRSLLQAFAALAGLAIVNARAQQRERMLRERLEALDRATRAIAAELSLDQVLRRIVEIASEFIGARYGALGIAGPDGYLTDFITTGITPAEHARIGALPRGHGLLGTLIRDGKPLRAPDIGRDPRRVGFPPNHPSMTSLLGVPIRAHDRVVGDLYLTDKVGASDFSDDDQHLVELLAAHAGVAIENAQLFAREAETREALQRTMDSLRESERRARAIFEQSFQFVGLLSPEGILLDANQTALDFIVGTRAEVVGRHFWDTPWWRASPEARDRLCRAVSEAAGGQFVRYEVELPALDGTMITFDFSLSPVVDEAGRVSFLIPEARNISAIKALDRAHDELATLHERERIGRDLHDGIIQDIYAGTLQLDDIAEDLEDEVTRARLLAVTDHFSTVITDVRTYIQGLRVRRLEGRLLREGIEQLVREVMGQNGLAGNFAVEGEPYRLPDAAANTMLQIAREALANVVRHAQATAVEVCLIYAPGGVTLQLTDNGRGFEPVVVGEDGHFGLANLHQRAEESGGILTITSAPGAGTRLIAYLPSGRAAPGAESAPAVTDGVTLG